MAGNKKELPVAMPEPTQTDAIVETGKGVVATAGGGGLIAVLLEFFRGRERTRMTERLTRLEGEVATLRDLVARLVRENRRAARKGARKK